jgi:hypothetical protein
MPLDGTERLALQVGAQARNKTLLGSEQGWTLIEQLWWIILGAIVAGGVMIFVIVSLHQENAVSSSAFASQSAQVGLQQLTHDFIQAQNLPDATAANGTGNDTPVVINYTGTGFTAVMYLPVSGSVSTGTQITWSCVAQSSTTQGTCTRTVGGVSTIEINGVISAAITPIDSSGNTIGSCAGDPHNSVLSACSGVSHSSTAQAVFPTSLALSLQVSTISQADAAQTHTVAGTSQGEAFNTSIQLRNY